MARRRAAAAQADADTEYQHQGAFVSVMPLPVAPVDPAHVQGTAGWAPAPGATSNAMQIGAYRGSMLNQFPANIPGVQLHSGVEWLHSGFYTPARYGIPNQSGVQPTQQHANLPGAQRYGSLFSGPQGPLTVAASRERVVVAQIRASGANALGWARKLNPNYVPSGDDPTS